MEKDMEETGSRREAKEDSDSEEKEIKDGPKEEETKEEAKAKEDSGSVEKEKAAEEYTTLTCGGVKEVRMIGMDGQEVGTTAL